MQILYVYYMKVLVGLWNILYCVTVQTLRYAFTAGVCNVDASDEWCLKQWTVAVACPLCCPFIVKFYCYSSVDVMNIGLFVDEWSSFHLQFGISADILTCGAVSSKGFSAKTLFRPLSFKVNKLLPLFSWCLGDIVLFILAVLCTQACFKAAKCICCFYCSYLSAL